jgi:putative transposase
VEHLSSPLIKMKLVKKLKLKLNKETKEYLQFASEKCRLIYNFALAEKIKYYEETGKSISIYKLKKKLPEIKQKYPEYKKVYNKCLSAMYFRLDKAYKLFFTKYNSFPKFKRKGKFVSQEYPAEYIKVLSDHMFVLPTGRGFKNYMARTYEPIPEDFTILIVTKKRGSYYANFIVEQEEKQPTDNGESIAIDLGIKTLVTGISSQEKWIKVTKFSHYTKHLDWIRSNRDRKKKGSRRWKKWDTLFAKRLEQYQNRIKDYLHKASYWLINRPESTIILGRLNLESMKTEKSWFNRIVQNEWRVKMFCRMLDYKAGKFGKKIVYVDETYTTRTCFNCENKQTLTLLDQTYKCNKCGFILDRDLNSALNIMKKYSLARALAPLEGSACEIVDRLSNLEIIKYVYI